MHSRSAAAQTKKGERPELRELHVAPAWLHVSPVSVPESPFAVQGLAQRRFGPKTPDFTPSSLSDDLSCS